MKGKKTGGRRPGSPNRTTAELQKALLKLLDDNLSKLQSDLDMMKGKDRATILLNLAKHVTPPAISFEKLTEAQLQELYDFILNKQKNE